MPPVSYTHLDVYKRQDYEIETVTEAFEGTVQSKLGIDAQKDSIEIYKQKEDIFYTVQKGDGGEIGYSCLLYTSRGFD